MHKSTATRLLDLVRYLLTISGTITILWFSTTKISWVLSIIAAIPVYVVIFYLVDFLTLPLWSLTPEQKALSRILRAIEKDDLERALKILKAYENSPSFVLQTYRLANKKIRQISGVDLIFASGLLLLLLVTGNETFLDRLSCLDKHTMWKSLFSCFIFGISFVAVAHKVWIELREIRLERARCEVENILKKRLRLTFERFIRLDPKYTPELLDKLIRTYPNIFRRTTAKKKKKPVITLIVE